MKPSDSNDGIGRTWSVKRGSLFSTILPSIAIMIGLVVFVSSTWGLIKPWGGNTRSGFVIPVILGLAVTAYGAFAFVVVVRHVELLEDGRYRFLARFRAVVVRPDEIISMRGLTRLLDTSGAYPFRMRTTKGSALVDRHMTGGPDLEAALCEANPALAVIRAWDLERRSVGE
jgi:hypothetical protein